MARVFLSYGRDDADRARHFARVLEKAGHHVWWDLHVKSGAQYTKVIEDALKQADAVVVLWSTHSVNSAWVRDEAAAGRDTGRLVPVTLDNTDPPLGFRQFQTLDLSRWKGRGTPTQLRTLLDDVNSMGDAPKQAFGLAPSPDRERPALRRKAQLAISMIAAAVVILTLFAWRPWASTTVTPAVTVVASDSSPAAQDLARDLLVQLGSLQAANADALELLEPRSGTKPDLTFKVGAQAGLGDPRAQLSLIDNKAGALLWSRAFVQPGGNAADLRQQLAYSAARVLHCATEAFSPDHPKIKLSTLKLYLNGCADASNLLARDPAVVVPTFKQVTEEAPAFAGGWAKLLLAEIEALRQANLADPALQTALRAHIELARKLNPTMAEAYLAEEWLQPPRPITGWMKFGDQAVAKNPSHPLALSMQSLGLRHVGLMEDAVELARRAVRLEPLSPSARETLIDALMDSGAIEAARHELGEAERLWPGATNLLKSRFTLESRHGDPKEGLRILKSGQLGFSTHAAHDSFLRARADPSSANVNRAVVDARNSFRREQGSYLSSYIQTLAAFGGNEELIAVLLSVDPRSSPGIVVTLFRPAFATLRRDPRFMVIAKRFGLLDYWRERGRWPDFCLETDQPYDCKEQAASVTSATSQTP